MVDTNMYRDAKTHTVYVNKMEPNTLLNPVNPLLWSVRGSLALIV